MSLTGHAVEEAVLYNRKKNRPSQAWEAYQETIGTSPDGIPGPNTARALAAWQKRQDLPENGKLTADTETCLMAHREPRDTPPVLIGAAPPPARLQHASCPLTRDGGRAFMLSELTHPERYPERPFPVATESTTGRQRAHAVTLWLNPEQHQRHIRNASSTYCNVYAHDAAEAHQHPVRNASGDDPHWKHGHLPRTAWRDPASEAARMARAVYGETCVELNANKLTEWIQAQCHNYGWINPTTGEPGCWSGDPKASGEAIESLQEAIENYTAGQEAIGKNGYAIGVICTRQENRSWSGHVCIVLPELGDRRAGSKGGHFSPLMSQAGSTNRNFFTDSTWFRSRSYDLLVAAWCPVPHLDL